MKNVEDYLKYSEELFKACVDIVGRTHALEFKIRYCEEQRPTIWIATGRWKGGWQVAAGMTPHEAALKLAEDAVDGGKCKYCGKQTGLTVETNTMPLSQSVCWYQLDPNLKKFMRGCALWQK